MSCTADYKRRLREANSTIINNYKKAHGCLLCGTLEDLTFHHVNPEEKIKQVGSLRNYSYKKVMDEIKKCVVLCVSCHSEEHRLHPELNRKMCGVSND